MFHNQIPRNTNLRKLTDLTSEFRIKDYMLFFPGPVNVHHDIILSSLVLRAIYIVTAEYLQMHCSYGQVKSLAGDYQITKKNFIAN